MRTVDPDLWSKKLIKQHLNISTKFGLKEMSGLEVRLRKSFRDAVMDLWRNSSVEGIGFTTDRNSPKCIRWIYIILLTLSIIGGCIVISLNARYYWNSPHLMVNRQYHEHTMKKIHFPAVAICSYNIISRDALENYANYLYSLDRYNVYNITEIKMNLLAFGALHSNEILPYDFNFVSHLAKVARETNVTNILYKLSPKCNAMLVRCSWRSRRIPCRRLFAARMTNLGFCCVFNSRYDFADRHKFPKKTDLLGRDAGLSVIVRENSDDFTYARRLGNSVEVLLFDGEQYPLMKTGVVRSYIAARNASVYFKLSAHTQEAAANLKLHDDNWLGCHMADGVESPVQSWAWCIGLCRSEASLALCQCIPHYLPPLDSSSDTCSLEHIPCLAKHKEKFTFLYPGEDVHESLSEEKEDSVECLHCVRGCVRRRYWADVATLPYPRSFFLNKSFKGTDLTNTTIISIYFESENQHLFLVETGVRWFEACAIISSQFVIVLGVTVVSVLELVYHCTFRCCHHFMRRRRYHRLVPKLNQKTA